MGSYRRAIGFCANSECKAYTKSLFLLNHGDVFTCGVCHKPGTLEREIARTTGQGEYKEVVIDYLYNPIEKKYRSTLILRIEAMEGIEGKIYTLSSPLIQTNKRANKVAETILANLLQTEGDVADGPPITSTETTLSFDDSREVFSKKLKRFSKSKLEVMRRRQ